MYTRTCISRQGLRSRRTKNRGAAAAVPDLDLDVVGQQYLLCVHDARAGGRVLEEVAVATAAERVAAHVVVQTPLARPPRARVHARTRRAPVTAA